ncbi:MAG: lamin tail domain-containing protein [Patescibacteria group bacterium]|nr:lamin tail domain-containing protein [Patescibacteria group bacterium]
MNKFILSSIILFLSIFVPQKAIAISGNVVINEIFPHPASGSKNEFIEIYNPTNMPVDLSDWQLDDIANGGSSPYKINSGTIISAYGYLAFYKSETSIALNDSGDTVRLLNPGGEEIFSVSYTESEKDLIYARDISDIWYWTKQATPGAINADKIQYSKSVFINEILADPSEGTDSEFIEIYNASNQAIDLSGWYIDDAKDSGSSPYKIGEGTIIEPNSYQVFYHKTTNISLNNDGDSARLINPLGEEVSSIPYPKSEKNSSYIRTNNGTWLFTNKITPGKINILISPAEEKFFSDFSYFIAKKIKTGEVGSYLDKRVEISGTLVDNNGQTFYIDDGSGQAKITIQAKTNISKPKMRVGDIIKVIGWVDEYRNVFRVLPENEEDIKVESGKSTSPRVKNDNNQVQLAENKTTSFVIMPGENKINNLLAGLNSVDYNNKSSSALTRMLKIVIITSSILLILLIFQYLWSKKLLPVPKQKLRNWREK